MTAETINLDNLSLAELRSELRDRFERADAIQAKYPNGVVPKGSEDETEFKSLLLQVDGMEQRRVDLEQAQKDRDLVMAGVDRYRQPAPGQYVNPEVQKIQQGKKVDPGTQFITSREYRELKGNGAFNSHLNRVNFHVTLSEGTSLMEWKDLLQNKALVYAGSDSVGGALVVQDRAPGFVDILQRQLNVLDLIPRMQTDSDTVEYVRETAFTNAAAFVAEASVTTGTTGLKPESTLTFDATTAPVKTLAHWIPVTNRMLSDAPAIRGIINGRLLYGLDNALETQVLTGNGSGENLTGILAMAGKLIQGLNGGSVLDAIYNARTQVRVTGLGSPTAVVLHPNDFAAIRLARENAATGTLGNYLMGPPSLSGPVTVWGIPVVESAGITENTALVADFRQGATLFDREQAAIRVGTIDDQFVRNMQTILAELRVAFVAWRPAMFCVVTGV